MQKIMKDQNWQDQEALLRYTMIAPLLDESLDSAKRSQIRGEIAEKMEISERTLYRYEAAYKAAYSALKGLFRTHATEGSFAEGTPEEIGKGIAGPSSQKHYPQANLTVFEYSKAQINMGATIKGAQQNHVGK